MKLRVKFCLRVVLSLVFFLGFWASGIEVTNWKTYTTFQYLNQIEEKGDILYIATNGGLVLFSPQKESMERVYTYQDGLLSHYVNSFAWDREGNLWLATSYRGLLVFSKEKFFHYPSEKVPSTINKVAISGDTVLLGTPDGVYFIATQGSFLNFADDNVLRLLSGNRILGVYPDEDFWLGCSRGIFRITRDLQRVFLYRLSVGDSVKGILKAKDTLFVIAEKGLAYYEPRFDTFSPYLFFYAVSPDTFLLVNDFKFSGGRFYIATNKGTFTYDGEHFLTLNNYWTMSIYVADYLLLGIRGSTYASGFLVKIQEGREKWISFPTIVTNSIFDIAKDYEDNLYLPHFMWGENHLTVITKDSITRLKDTLPVPDFVKVCSKDRIWIGHWAKTSGLSVYDKEKVSWRVFQWGGVSGKNVIGAFNIDQNDTKWMWNEINVIALDSQETAYEFSIPGLGSCQHGYEFTFDSKGRVYLGTPNGLIRFDYKGTLSDPADDSIRVFMEGLVSFDIKSCASDRQDRIWVGTPQGLGCLQGERFKVYTKENSGLVSSNCLRVRTDTFNRVWILTEGGLSLFYPEKDSWQSFTPVNSALFPNWKNIMGFYSSLFVDRDKVYIGTKEGLIEMAYREITPPGVFNLEIYPNPFLVGKNLKLIVDKIPDSCAVELFTLSGKKVEVKCEKIKDGFSLEIKDSLSSGLYIIRVRELKPPYRCGIGKVAILK